MRRAAIAALVCFGAVGATIGSSCAVTYGDLPAKCGADAACPDGYTCIHDVCAKPGTPIPATVTSLQYLRGSDLRLIPTAHDAVVMWEIYQYDTELFQFAGARVSASGDVGAQQILVDGYPASSNYLEPYFDAFATSDTAFLLAIGAAPPPGATYSDARLTLFNVTIPTSEAGSPGTQLWESQMPSIGYGAVSQPRFAQGPKSIELGYFETLTARNAVDMTKKDTIGKLALFSLDTSGNRGAMAKDCEASACIETRKADPSAKATAALPVAVSVVDAIAGSDSTYWVIDDTRPSVVREIYAPSGPTTYSDLALSNLAIPTRGTGDSLAFIAPSDRGGDKLPDDPVVGNAKVDSVTVPGGTPAKLIDLDAVRDSPRPAYVRREGKPDLLITPGGELGASELRVYEVDNERRVANQVATIPRYASLDIGAVRAAVVEGHLYVTWLDVSADTATIRAAVIAEP